MSHHKYIIQNNPNYNDVSEIHYKILFISSLLVAVINVAIYFFFDKVKVEEITNIESLNQILKTQFALPLALFAVPPSVTFIYRWLNKKMQKSWWNTKFGKSLGINIQNIEGEWKGIIIKEGTWMKKSSNIQGNLCIEQFWKDISIVLKTDHTTSKSTTASFFYYANTLEVEYKYQVERKKNSSDNLYTDHSGYAKIIFSLKNNGEPDKENAELCYFTNEKNYHSIKLNLLKSDKEL